MRYYITIIYTYGAVCGAWLKGTCRYAARSRGYGMPTNSQTGCAAAFSTTFFFFLTPSRQGGGGREGTEREWRRKLSLQKKTRCVRILCMYYIIIARRNRRWQVDNVRTGVGGGPRTERKFPFIGPQRRLGGEGTCEIFSEQSRLRPVQQGGERGAVSGFCRTVRGMLTFSTSDTGEVRENEKPVRPGCVATRNFCESSG